MTPGWRRLACALFVLSPPAVAVAGSPIVVQADLAQAVLVVGEPLTIELRATNVSAGTVGPFDVYSSDFTLTFYWGDIVEGCDVFVSVPEPVPPPPPRPPLFSFAWQVDALAPGETATCRITYTQTLFPGTETITLSSVIDQTIWRLAEFTYALVPVRPDARAVGVPLGPGAWLACAALMLVSGTLRLRARR